MRVFVAGGSGAIGFPLVRSLVAAGHAVTALTRSARRHDDLRAAGASVAVADALDRDALVSAVMAAHPTHVVHELTALPKYGPRRPSDLDATNRLRVDGTRNLLEATVASGARRFVAGSFALLAPRQPAAGSASEAAAAVQSMEDQVLEATRRGSIEGVILRYGMLYGTESPSTVALIDQVQQRRVPVVRGDQGRLPWIHVEDAVSATVRALELAPAGATYDIVDDRAVSWTEIVRTVADYTGSPSPRRLSAWLLRLLAPYMARMMSSRLSLSNARAKAELGWHPRYPTLPDGLADMLRHTA